MERNTYNVNINREQLFSLAHTNCAKGVAAVMIVVFHLFIAWQWPRVVNVFGSVGVAMFLFMSGFGINESWKKNGLTHYWRKKLCRVVLPFWLFVLVLLPFRWNETFNNGWNDYNYDGCSLLMELSFLGSKFWFIPYLMWNYALYWLLQRFFSRYLVVLWVVVALVSLNILFQIAAEQSFSFLAGVLASRYIAKLRTLNARYILLAAVVLMSFGIAFMALKELPAVHAWRGTLPYHYILLMIKLPLGLSLLLLLWFMPWLLRSRFFYLSGISSMEIYLIHLTVVDRVALQWLPVLGFIVFTIVGTFIYYQINNRIIAKIL